MKYFLTVCLNPTIQRTWLFDSWCDNQINRATKKIICASGKGINTTRVLQQLQANVVHLTHTAKDSQDPFLSFCKAEKLSIESVTSPIETRLCCTLINSQNHHVTEVIEPSSAVPIQTEEDILKKFHKLVPNAHTVAFCGSVAPGFSTDVFAKMTAMAKKAGATVFLDTRGSLLVQSLKNHPDFIKINIFEFMETFFPNDPINPDDFSEIAPLIQQKARELLMRHHTRTILTLGKKGCIAYDKQQKITLPPPQAPGEVINTTGCGDTFLAGLMYKFHENPNDLLPALEFASECAAKNATTLKPGDILD